MNKLLTKLYKKSEIWFAVVLIIVYVIPASNLRGNFGDNSIWMMLYLLFLTLLITFFICKNGLAEKYGLTSWPNSRKFLYFFPFIVLISVNLWFSVKPSYRGMGQIYAVVSMILVGFLEEMIFRGFLFRAIEKESLKRAIAISALTFGMGHIINLLKGHASLDTIAQILYATAIGFVLVFVLLMCDSKYSRCFINKTPIYIIPCFSIETDIIYFVHVIHAPLPPFAAFPIAFPFVPR